ncbi:MAG: type II/IV secretion system ATPase subunit [Methanomicrobiales archaeon]
MKAPLFRILDALRFRLKETDFQLPVKNTPLSVPTDCALPLVPSENGEKVVDHYWLVPGYASAAVISRGEWEHRYCVIEPPLWEYEYYLLNEVQEYIRDVILFDEPKKEGDLRLEYGDVRKVIDIFDSRLPEDRIDILYYYLQRTFEGYGKLDPMMRDDYLEDISCSGPCSPVYIYHRNYGSIPTGISFQEDELNRFILKLAQKADKQVSLTSPLVDAALPDGSRIQLTFSDVVSTRGSSFTIRKFRRDPMTPVHLIDYGTYDPDILALIWLAVENRMNLIVVGGTASGKTSTMNAISFFIPTNAKIVSIEDTREIQLPHANWLPTQTREIGLHAAAADLDMFALLKAALRQRPEFLLVGEVRGREAQTLFQAMNTGHTTFSTLHAGSVGEAVNRLVNEPISVPPAMFGALDLVVVQSLHYYGGHAVRRCDSLNEIMVDEDGHIRWNTLFEWDPVTDRFVRTDNSSMTLEQIGRMHGWSGEEQSVRLRRRRDFLERASQDTVRDADSVMHMICKVRADEHGI